MTQRARAADGALMPANAIVSAFARTGGEESRHASSRARMLAHANGASLYVVRLDPNTRRAAQAAAISAAAEDVHAALVVVGGRHSSIGKSLAEHVHDTASSPVLHVRNPVAGRYTRVVVGIDTTTKPAAMVEAARFVAPTAAVEFVHLYDTPYEPLLVGQGAGLVDIRAYRADAARDAREQVLAQFAEAGMRVEPPSLSFLAGSARDLAERVPRGSLLVLQRGRSWMRHFVFGSVTRAVIHGSGPDVLVV